MEVIRIVERINELLIQLGIDLVLRKVHQLLQRVLVCLEVGFQVVRVVVGLVETAASCETNITHFEVTLKTVDWLGGVDCEEGVLGLVDDTVVLQLSVTEAVEELRVAASCIECFLGLFLDRTSVTAVLSAQVLVDGRIETRQTLTVVIVLVHLRWYQNAHLR